MCGRTVRAATVNHVAALHPAVALDAVQAGARVRQRHAVHALPAYTQRLEVAARLRHLVRQQLPW